MKLPVTIRFLSMAPCAPAEASARRRILALDRQHPSVMSWDVLCERPDPHTDPAGGYAVKVTAHLVRGGIAAARAQGPDLRAALEVAFDAVDLQLEGARLDTDPVHEHWLAPPPERGTAALRLH